MIKPHNDSTTQISSNSLIKTSKYVDRIILQFNMNFLQWFLLFILKEFFLFLKFILEFFSDLFKVFGFVDDSTEKLKNSQTHSATIPTIRTIRTDNLIYTLTCSASLEEIGSTIPQTTNWYHVFNFLPFF